MNLVNDDENVLPSVLVLLTKTQRYEHSLLHYKNYDIQLLKLPQRDVPDSKYSITTEKYHFALLLKLQYRCYPLKYSISTEMSLIHGITPVSMTIEEN